MEVDLSIMQDKLIEYHKKNCEIIKGKLEKLIPGKPEYHMLKKNFETQINDSHYLYSILENYKTIMERFDRQIRTAISLGYTTARLEVPPFVFGFPLYDIGKATRYLIKQVQNLGYSTAQNNNFIVVRWGSEPSAPILHEDQPNEEFPTLINLRKIASKIKSTHKNKNGGAG
jgi:hypothetical protein